MASAVELTVLPPDSADETPRLSRIGVVLHESDHAALIGLDGERAELPAEVYAALRAVVAAMAQGQAVAVVPRDTILTTQGAADLLGVSRPTLVRLLEEGQIPFTTPGRHRRIALADLTAYQDRVRAHRRVVLDEMARDAAADDAYTPATGFVSTR